MKLSKTLIKIKNNSISKLDNELIEKIFQCKSTDINLYNEILNELSKNTSINFIYVFLTLLDNPQIIELINTLKNNNTYKKVYLPFMNLDDYYNYTYINEFLKLKNTIFIINNYDPFTIYNDNIKKFISSNIIIKYSNACHTKFENNRSYLRYYTKYLNDNENNPSFNKQNIINIINTIKQCIDKNINNTDDIEYVIKNCNVISLNISKTEITQNISNLLKENDTIYSLSVRINNFNPNVNYDNLYSFLKYNIIQKLHCYNIKNDNINILLDNVKDNTNINKLELTFKLPFTDNLTNNNLNNFISYLKSNNTIKTLKFNNFKSFNILSEVFKYNTSINKLILYSACLKNKEDCINYFINSLISNKTLKYLSINKNSSTNNYFNNKTLSITDNNIISNLLKYNSTLETLKLCNCSINLNNIDLGLLKSNTTLTTLDLSYNNIDNIENIAESLLTNSTLTKLNLSSNKITDINCLSSVLNKNTTLQKLYLQNNNIFKKDKFIEALKSNKTIFKLSYEIINNQDFISLCNSLKYNSYLSNLLIYAQSYNDNVIENYNVKPILDDLLNYNNTLINIDFYSIGNDDDGYYDCC